LALHVLPEQVLAGVALALVAAAAAVEEELGGWVFQAYHGGI